MKKLSNIRQDDRVKRENIAPEERKILEDLEKTIGRTLPLTEDIKFDVVGVEIRDDKIVGLGLFSCGLKELPASVGDLKSLEKLSLGNNLLKDLPETVGTSKSLKNLNLNTNKLTTLPEPIVKLRSLQTLILGINHLTSLPESFDQLELLQTLWINSNQLETLPESFGNLKSLQSFNIYHNRLTALPNAFGKLKALRMLDLGANRLSTIPESFGTLRTLQWLILSGNQLTALPETIGDIHTLEKLYLNDNQLPSLPKQLLQLRNLNTLRLSGNPWNQPELIKQIMKNFAITKSITDFLKSKEYHENLTKPNLERVVETFLNELFKKEINLFISYAMADSQRLRIPDIATELMNKSPDVNAIYWEGWDGYPDGNIIDYMEDNIVVANLFVPICTEASTESKNCKKERDMAYFQNKAVIPVFEDFKYVPPIFQPHKGLNIAGKGVTEIVDVLHDQVSALVKKT